MQMCSFKWIHKFGSVMGTALIASAPGRRLGKKGTNLLGNLSAVESRGRGRVRGRHSSSRKPEKAASEAPAARQD